MILIYLQNKRNLIFISSLIGIQFLVRNITINPLTTMGFQNQSGFLARFQKTRDIHQKFISEELSSLWGTNFLLIKIMPTAGHLDCHQLIRFQKSPSTWRIWPKVCIIKSTLTDLLRTHSSVVVKHAAAVPTGSNTTSLIPNKSNIRLEMI